MPIGDYKESGYGPLSKDLSDIIDGFVMTHKNLNADQITDLIMKDKDLITEFKPDREEVQNAVEGSIILFRRVRMNKLIESLKNHR